MFKKKGDQIDTRTAIMEATLELFAEKGYEAVSIRQIAKAANTNIALISYYFGSKEGLFKEILISRLPLFHDRLMQIRQSEASTVDKIFTIVELYSEKIMRNPHFNKIMIREMSLVHRPTHVQQIIDGIYPNWKIILDLIKEGQEKGEFRADIDVELTWTSIVGTIFQVLNNAPMTMKVLGLKKEEELNTKSIQIRVQKHLKQVLSSHLIKN